jgi:DHA1 family bicyclomycin/chloramphenicol resistance-like MFS transporter
VLLGISYVLLPETLPAGRRSGDTAAATLRTMRSVMTDRAFLVNALGCGIGFGAIFSYVAGAPFALENTFGLSPAMFSLAFGLNGAGLIIASHINGRLVGRLGPMRLFTYGAISLATGSVGLLVLIATHWLGLPGVLACMFLVVSSNGFVSPNAVALALDDFPHAAGSASALLGLLQFSVGAVAAPLVGVAGPHDDLPMGIAVAFFGASALTVRMALMRRLPAHPRQPPADVLPLGPRHSRGASDPRGPADRQRLPGRHPLALPLRGPGRSRARHRDQPGPGHPAPPP